MFHFNVDKRSNRLTNLIRKAPNTPTFALANTYSLSHPEKEALRFACLSYLWHCAHVFDKFIPVPDGSDWFGENAESICKLPNITPNGVVLPKLETMASYNFIHSIIARIMSRYFNNEVITGIHLPVNIRLIDGRPNQKIDSRPRSSTKFHSDVWAAEPSNSMAIFIPVLGAINETTVEFIEPMDFPDEFQRPLDDFNLGQSISDGGIPYPGIFSEIQLVTADALCLHRTKKNDTGFRLSIDFRVLHKTQLDSDIYLKSPRLKNYVSPGLWYSIGEKHWLVPQKSINDVITDQAKDAYVASFDVKET